MPTIAELNLLDRDAFVAALAFVFEGEPWIQTGAWELRPFDDVAGLHAALLAVLRAADTAQQLALIRAHPDLAGKAALAGALTAESTREQAAAGLGALTAEQYARFHELNAAYHAQFGFPFIICAREHTSASILAAFATRLTHERATEIKTALDEIGKIAWLRLAERVQE